MTVVLGWSQIGACIGWSGRWAREYHARAVAKPETGQPLPVRYRGRTPISTAEELSEWLQRLPKERP